MGKGDDVGRKCLILFSVLLQARKRGEVSSARVLAHDRGGVPLHETESAYQSDTISQPWWGESALYDMALA